MMKNENEAFDSHEIHHLAQYVFKNSDTIQNYPQLLWNTSLNCILKLEPWYSQILCMDDL